MTQKLPEGYVNLGVVSLHRDDVRRFTEDLERFIEHLPAAVSLMKCVPGGIEARTIFEEARHSPEIWEGLMLTVAELADFYKALKRTEQAMQAPAIVIN